MKKPYIIFYSFLLIACALALPSCGQSSDKTKSTISAEDDRPPLEFTDADRTFNVKNDSGIHIIVGSGVSDATLEKVKQSIIDCGIKNISISNF